MPLPEAYLNGDQFGLPASCKVHRLANIATDKLHCGEHCRIDAFVTITGDVRLGAAVHLGTGCGIWGGYGVRIGTGTSISPGAKIFSATEDVGSVLKSNPQLPGRAFKWVKVRIGAFCVIGSGTVLLPGSVIGHEVVIGALSLVKGDIDIDSGGVYAGSPVRFIKHRTPVNRLLSLGEDVIGA